MGLAGAGYGAAQGLEEIVAERLAQQRLAAQIAQQADERRLQEAALNERKRQDEADRAHQSEREKVIDDERGAQKRQLSNKQGVRQMIGEAMQQGTPVGNMRGMAFSEGIDLPDEPKPVRDPIKDFEAEEQIRAKYRAPTKPDKPGVHVVGGNLVDDSGKILFTDPNKGASDKPSDYSIEHAARTVQAVDDLMGKVSNWTAGAGSVLSALPATDATDFAAQLDTLKSNIAFNELTQMREASKTGGALGAVSEREMALLQSTLGALNPRQKPETLKAQLQKVKDSVQRWQTAKGIGNMSPAPSHGAPQNAPAAKRFTIVKTEG